MPNEELGRRALLLSAGCALLGACTSPGGTPESAPPTTQGAGAGAGSELVVAPVAAVPVGGGIVANGLVLLQLTAGEFTAYDAVCPHQDFKLQAPNSNGMITCLGHNSNFQATDGSRVDGPAPRGLTRVPVKVSGDQVVRG